MGESPNLEWTDQWQALARQYTNAWQELARGAGVAHATPAPTWPQGMEQFSRMFASGSDSQGESVGRMIDGARNYAEFAQAMLSSMAGAGGAIKPWTDTFAQTFPGAATASGFATPGAPSWPRFDVQGNDAMAQFMGMLSALRQPASAVDDLKGWMSLPAFGPKREQQEHYQQSAVAWIEYQEQMKRYNALMLKAAQRGFELFQGKLVQCEQPGRQIESLRALYDLWVDAAEEGYAEIALSADFREVYGALVNAQMRVRSQLQHAVERIATDLGMPTRSEVNSIGERLQALRREVRESSAPAGAELKAGVNRTRAELEKQRRKAKSGGKKKRRVAPDGVSPVVDSAPASVGKQKNKVRAGKASDVKRSSRATESKPKRKARRKDKAVSKPERAVAATASGNFASRIAKFANASLGSRSTRSTKVATKSTKHRKRIKKT